MAIFKCIQTLFLILNTCTVRLVLWFTEMSFCCLLLIDSIGCGGGGVSFRPLLVRGTHQNGIQNV